MRVLRVGALTALILCGTEAIYPCGGAEYYPVGAPFASYSAMLDRVLAVDEYWGPFRPAQVTFVYPMQAARPEATEPVRRMLDPYGQGDTTLPSVSLERFRAALEAGDLDAAERQARTVVEGVLDMPAPRADAFQAPMRRAVEFLELKATLARLPRNLVNTYFSDTASPDPARYQPPLREAMRIREMERSQQAAWADSAPGSPRAASLRYVALQEMMKREIPNGWKDDIRAAAPADLWRRLEAAHEQWLADFPGSPLADLVRLSRLRLYYLSGEAQRAWRLLLDFYPDRHYRRVIYEMRFLLANGAGPDSAALAHPHMDGPLRAATFEAPLEPEAWCAAWREAESHRPAAWAVNIEERLLYGVAEQQPVAVDRGQPVPLPPCFPTATSAPTPLWGRMRLMALLAAGREPEARAQLAALDTASDLSALRARFSLEDHRWVQAVLTPGLDSAAVLYLVRVLAPDTAVTALTGRGPLWIRREAALALAVGRAAAGDWAGGATLLRPVDPERSDRWSEAARLAADTTFAGRVAFARYLHRSRGRLTYPRDGVWLRSVVGRLPPEGADTARFVREVRRNVVAPDEPERIVRHLLSSTEDYLSLRAYGAALERPAGSTADLAGVVEEANGVYRSLIDWQYASNQFWYEQVHAGPEAAAIRRVGRQVRGR